MQQGVKSLRCIMQRGVKSLRCIIQRGVKSCSGEWLLAAGSQIKNVLGTPKDLKGTMRQKMTYNAT